jgi:hypothetical protein
MHCHEFVLRSLRRREYDFNGSLVDSLVHFFYSYNHKGSLLNI